MKKEDQFLKLEIKLADKILAQYKEEASFVLRIHKDHFPKVLHLLGIKHAQICENERYLIIPGEGIWPYDGSLEPSHYATQYFDPIPLIIGLEKIRNFLDEWDPENNQELSA